MSEKRSHRKICIIGGIASTVMFMFCFAMVPLYSVICKATGISTSVPISEWTRPVQGLTNEAPDLSRTITVQFVAVNNLDMPWKFYPVAKSVDVHPGKSAKIYFYAKNMTDKRMTVQAIPSMTPTDSISHFHKIECFCFNQQSLNGKESKNMGLVFTIDKDLPKEIKVITLAYTLFDVTPKDAKKG